MKYLLLILLLISTPLSAQTIFRATPIDEEQNTRLDNLETKFASLENSIENLTKTVEKQIVAKELELTYKKPAPVASSCACSDECTCGCEGSCSCSCSTPTLSGSVSYAQPVSYGSSISASTGSSGYYSSLRSQIQSRRTGRTYAHVSPSYAKTHLLEHGYSSQDVAGLSTSEAIELHNLTHGGIISPSGSHGQAVTTQSSCVNGQCAFPQRRGLFGFRK